MFSPRIKLGVFILEGLNSFAVTFYFFYFYFYTHAKFRFGDKANLTVAAVGGLICLVGSLMGGRFAQRRGCFAALKLGLSVMICGTLGSLALHDFSAGVVALMFLTTAGMCFTWAPLEALIAEGETYEGLQHNIGIYNIVWATTGAVAYFVGGGILEQLGLGSLFLVPAFILLVELGLVLYLHHEAQRSPHVPPTSPQQPDRPHATQPARAKAFLRMAWLANPFSYIASNTLIAVMPGVAQRLELSKTLAGCCLSVWCFSRLGAFVWLWLWSGWHYRFRWLLAGFISLIVSFAVILLIPNLAALIVAQIVFGMVLGLIYYSSLFYSMDVGEAKSEHGGIHEAAIGLGNFVGPAVGATSLYLLPQYAHSGALAVTGLLVCGLGGLLAIWRSTKT